MRLFVRGTFDVFVGYPVRDLLVCHTGLIELVEQNQW